MREALRMLACLAAGVLGGTLGPMVYSSAPSPAPIRGPREGSSSATDARAQLLNAALARANATPPASSVTGDVAAGSASQAVRKDQLETPEEEARQAQE